MDMTALKPVDHSFSWAGESVAITTRHGQAFLGTVRLSMKRKTLRAGGARQQVEDWFYTNLIISRWMTNRWKEQHTYRCTK
jgi:hypothetical protein